MCVIQVDLGFRPLDTMYIIQVKNDCYLMLLNLLKYNNNTYYLNLYHIFQNNLLLDGKFYNQTNEPTVRCLAVF